MPDMSAAPSPALARRDRSIQARREAREFGELWWKNQKTAKRDLLDQRNLNGLGGYLALVGLGLLASALVQLYGLFSSNRASLNSGYGIVNIAFVAATVCLIILFFKKKRAFPPCSIIFLNVNYLVASFPARVNHNSNEAQIASASALWQAITWITLFPEIVASKSHLRWVIAVGFGSSVLVRA